MIKTTTLTQEQIREMNRVKIIKMLKSLGETTKQEIAVALGLSIPTVTTNIHQLVEAGLVEEAGVAQSTGGRKPIILKFIPDARHSFGVNLGSSMTEIILMNLNQDTVARSSFDYEESEAFESILDRIQKEIEAMIIEHKLERKNILGVGIALPGLVDDDHLVLENAPNLGIKNYSFEAFQSRMGLKISIENEANIAAFAEQLLGNARDKGNLVYISVTDGLGAGIIIENHIYKSNHKKAGEFGHIRVSDEDNLCKCGRKGCWELSASRKALMRSYSSLKNEKIRDLKRLFEAYHKGEPEAVEALSRYTTYLFKGIDNILLALNPDFVIIGGDLGMYSKDIVDLAQNKLHLTAKFFGYEETQILESGLKDNGALLGSALLPMEEIFNYKKNVI